MSAKSNALDWEKKKYKMEQEAIASAGRKGMFRGTNFVSNAQQEAERKQSGLMDMQALQNKGALDPVKYRQDAMSGRDANQLGFDRSKYQQTFDETRRTGDRDFNTKVFDTKYKNEADKKKAWESGINELVYGRGMPLKDATALMRNRERYYNENVATGIEQNNQDNIIEQNNQDNIYESRDANGVRSFSNSPPTGQSIAEGREMFPNAFNGVAGGQTPINQNAGMPAGSNTQKGALETFNKVGSNLNKPLGQDFLKTNLAKYTGLNAAAKFNRQNINQPLSNIWGASTKIGQGMINAGGNAGKFLLQEYESPQSKRLKAYQGALNTNRWDR